MLDASGLRTVGTYVYNPACACDWCRNGGTSPSPGAPAALGYAEPHFPPPGADLAHLSPWPVGKPGAIFGGSCD